MRGTSLTTWAWEELLPGFPIGLSPHRVSGSSSRDPWHIDHHYQQRRRAENGAEIWRRGIIEVLTGVANSISKLSPDLHRLILSREKALAAAESELQPFLYEKTRTTCPANSFPAKSSLPSRTIVRLTNVSSKQGRHADKPLRSGDQGARSGLFGWTDRHRRDQASDSRFSEAI